MSLEKPDAIDRSRTLPPPIDATTRPFLSSYSAVNSGEFLLESLWRVLQKRKWIIIASVVVVFTIALIMSARMTPIYDAQCSLELSQPVNQDLGLRGSSSMQTEYWDYAVEMETQTKILRSDSLALEVIRKLQLDTNPRFSWSSKKSDDRAKVLVSDSMNPDPAKQAGLLARFRGGLKVSSLPRTKIIEVHYSHSDPNLAANIANAVADAYIEQNIRTKYESTMQTSDWISKQLSDLRLKTETAQEKLVRYQKEHGILGIDEKQNIITSKLDELNRQLTTAEGDRIQKEANYRMAIASPDVLTRSDSSVTVMSKLQADRATLLTKYAELSTTFGQSYPKLVEIKTQLDDVDRQISAEAARVRTRLKGDFMAAEEREKMLRSALEDQKHEANQLNESAIEYNLLKRDLDTSRQLYEGLLQRLKEAGVTAGLKSNNIRVIDAARAPMAPSSPNVPRNLVLSLMVGLVVGLMLAFVQEAMDNTLRTPEQVQAISSLASLGFIPLEPMLSPRSKVLGRKTEALLSADSPTGGYEKTTGLAVLHKKPFSEMAESYRALRTSILLSSLGAPPKVILVTSPLPQEGKSTTAMNCAAVLAQQGSRVLLVDADMRRPRVASALNLPSQVGLSNLLTGSEVIDNVIQTVPDVPNLFAVGAGPIPPHPAELLGSNLMERYIEIFRERFDHVIIDTPPALSVTDAVMLSAKVDSVLIVIFAGRTRKEALRRVRELFIQVNARLMGVVVNGVDLHSPDHYYYYYGKRYGEVGYYGSAYRKRKQATEEAKVDN